MAHLNPRIYFVSGSIVDRVAHRRAAARLGRAKPDFRVWHRCALEARRLRSFIEARIAPSCGGTRPDQDRLHIARAIDDEGLAGCRLASKHHMGNAPSIERGGSISAYAPEPAPSGSWAVVRLKAEGDCCMSILLQPYHKT
jgi:hypothetical protein